MEGRQVPGAPGSDSETGGRGEAGAGGGRGTGKGLLARMPGAWPQGWRRGPAWQEAGVEVPRLRRNGSGSASRRQGKSLWVCASFWWEPQGGWGCRLGATEHPSGSQGKKEIPMKRDPQQGGDVAPVSTAAAIFRGPRTNLQTESPPPESSPPAHSRPTECRRALPPGPSLCDRQRPLPCPTATPPGSRPAGGSTIGRGRGEGCAHAGTRAEGSAAGGHTGPFTSRRRGPGLRSQMPHRPFGNQAGRTIHLNKHQLIK